MYSNVTNGVMHAKYLSLSGGGGGVTPPTFLGGWVGGNTPTT